MHWKAARSKRLRKRAALFINRLRVRGYEKKLLVYINLSFRQWGGARAKKST